MENLLRCRNKSCQMKPNMQKIVFNLPSSEMVEKLGGYIQRNLIRFGVGGVKESRLAGATQLVISDFKSFYLKNGKPWAYPFERVIGEFPECTIQVTYEKDGFTETEFFGERNSGPITLEKGVEPTQVESTNVEKTQLELGHTTGPKIERFDKTEPPVGELSGSRIMLSHEREQRLKEVESKLDQVGSEMEAAKNKAEELEAKKQAETQRADAAEEQLARLRAKIKREEERVSAEAEIQTAQEQLVVPEKTEEDLKKERFLGVLYALRTQMAGGVGFKLAEPIDTPSIEGINKTAHLIREGIDADGMTGFHRAARDGVLTKLSLEELTEANLLVRDGEGNTALHWAAAKGNLSQIPGNVLSENNLLIRNEHQVTPVHMAALGGCLGHLPKNLLQREYILDETGTGCTCLHLAALNGNLVRIPAEFLTYEALSMTNQNGQTPIEVAEGAGHKDSVPAEVRSIASDPSASINGKSIQFREAVRRARWKL